MQDINRVGIVLRGILDQRVDRNDREFQKPFVTRVKDRNVRFFHIYPPLCMLTRPHTGFDFLIFVQYIVELMIPEHIVYFIHLPLLDVLRVGIGQPEKAL